MLKLDPLTKRKLNRFKSIKRGYYSFLILITLIILTLFAEVFINSRALLVRYNNEFYFPTYSEMIPGTTFGLDYEYETNYRDLKKKFSAESEGNFVVLPIVSFNPLETDYKEGEYPPYAPSIADNHYLGTDISGRDIVARLVYGFRIAILFSLILLCINYAVGITIGCLMGYYGGWFDLLMQRLIEIWSEIPFLYAIIIVASILIPNFFTLIGIMVLFGWMGMTWYMRTAVYKEKACDYVQAAKALGASPARIIFNHIIPNTIALIVTFLPFSISGGITALSSLDYLGFGLPPPTPSWGELLHQGVSNLNHKWILASVVIAMVLILSMVTFVGEAIREAFDPKKHTTYE